MRRAREDGGQSTVELALVLPVVCLLLLLVIQVGLIVHAQLVVGHAAREGARAAAVDEHPLAAEVAVVAGVPLDQDQLTVQTSRGDERVQVEVVYRYSSTMPVVGSLVPDLDLSASATMRREY